ncbi:MAG: aspartate-semialdehyde dehydrogenase [Acidobacteria bacterium]|nr:MAG: aspartate-semialdehyde dehydrogenase [Acidobacteriota bacterium]
MSTGFNVAIAGATGAVGAEFIRLLEEREFPVRQLKLLASAKSVGKSLEFKGQRIEVELLSEGSFREIDLALFSAGAGTSRQFAPHAVDSGAVVVDNSSAFRMDENVPLVIPEINFADISARHRIIANPNCTTIIALMGLYPLHRQFGVRRVVASSYQAVSGAGARAINELFLQAKAHLEGESYKPEVFPHPIAFNVLPQVDLFLETGYTKEELKFVNESRKILHYADLRASITCVRVPVFRAHSVAVHAEFDRAVSVAEAREALAKFPGLQVVDNASEKKYPMPLNCAGKNDCQIGRIRIDSAFDNGLAFWVCGDQLLKGAALNAVQIAENLALA